MTKNWDKKYRQYILNVLEDKQLKAVFFLLILGFMLSLTIMSSHNKLEPPDYGNHSAVVNELKHDIINPQHPFYGTAETTPYYTPYHVLAALFARFTNLSAIETLNLFGLFNLVLLFTGIYLFTKAYYGYFTNFSLLFILLLWRYNWGFSGEYGFRILPQVASFHSTFALGVMLIAFYVALKPSFIKIFFASALSAVAIISQPIISVAVVAGVIILFWKKTGEMKRIILPSLAYLILMLLFLYLWPYYPVIETFLGKATAFAGQNPKMATQTRTFIMYRPLLVFKIMWPLILFAPIALWGRLKENKHLLLLTIIIMIPYLAFASKNSELTGRMIIYAAFMLHITSAHAYYSKLLDNSKWALMLPFLFIVFAVNLYGGTLSKITRRTDIFREYKEELPVIARHIDHYDVVMTDIGSGYNLVGYSGKIVATSYGQGFVDDDFKRRQDVKAFHNPKTSNFERKKILDTYNARFILINKKEMTPSMDMPTVLTPSSLVDSLTCMGNVVIEMDQLKLVKIPERVKN